MTAFSAPKLISYTSVEASSASPSQKKLLEARDNAQVYDKAHIESFEQYLADQLNDQSVDIEANLALLRLYSIFPGHISGEKVAKVLAKLVTALPSSAFIGAAAMVPESLKEDESVKSTLSAGFKLQSCLFDDLWKEDLSFAKKHVPGFEDAVRAFMMQTIARSHSVISTSVVSSKLSLSDKETQDAIQKEGWEVVDGKAQIPSNEDNQSRPGKVQESFAVEDIMQVVQTLSR